MTNPAISPEAIAALWDDYLETAHPTGSNENGAIDHIKGGKTNG